MAFDKIETLPSSSIRRRLVADVRDLMHISRNIPVTANLVAMSHALKKNISEIGGETNQTCGRCTSSFDGFTYFNALN